MASIHQYQEVNGMNEKTNDQLLRMAEIRLRYIDNLLAVDEQDDELRATAKAELTQLMMDLTTLREQLG